MTPGPFHPKSVLVLVSLCPTRPPRPPWTSRRDCILDAVAVDVLPHEVADRPGALPAIGAAAERHVLPLRRGIQRRIEQVDVEVPRARVPAHRREARRAAGHAAVEIADAR